MAYREVVKEIPSPKIYTHTHLARMHPKQPVLKCDCDNPAHVFETMHPETIARAFYTCDNCHVSNPLQITHVETLLCYTSFIS